MKKNHNSCKNVQSLCRTCLTQIVARELKFNILQTPDLAKWMTVCTSLEVQDDILPKFLCKQCFDKLQSMYEFRAMCVRSMETLGTMVDADDDSTGLKDIKSDRLSEELTSTKEHKVSKDSSDLQETFEYTNYTDAAQGDDLDILKSTFNESKASKLVLLKENMKNGNIENCKKSVANALKLNNNTFKCENCSRRCKSQETLEAHKRTHNGLRPYQCSQCERSFHKASRLRNHMRETHEEHVVSVKCSYEGCGKLFRRIDTLRSHYRFKHAGAKNSQPKKYICEECGRMFRNATTLREHRYRHFPINEYPFRCADCDKRYVSQRTFKEHQMRHAGIKNFVCPHCGMRKTTLSELRTHINYHTKEKQWLCPHCASVFNSSANLGLHDRVVHKRIRRFVCKYCEQSFGKAETLKHHEMRHTGEKPHACQLCAKRFIQRVALRAHLKTHNKGIDANLSMKVQLE